MKYCFFTDRPNQTEIQVSKSIATIGEDVNIICRSNGRPKPNFTIIHNNVIVSTEPMYTIYSLQRSDAGIYTCIARNKLGSESSANVYLHVNDWGKVIDLIEHSRESDVPMTAKDYHKGSKNCRKSAKHSICTINIMFDMIPVNILYYFKCCHLIAYSLLAIDIPR